MAQISPMRTTRYEVKFLFCLINIDNLANGEEQQHVFFRILFWKE
jgi:hypothetical protein